MTQSWASCLKLLRTTWIDGATPSKTPTFLCFQSSQAPRMIKVLNPFLIALATCLQDLLHHCAKLESLIPGVRRLRPKQDSILYQNSLAKTQPTRMCWTVSSSWSQRAHRSGWGSPLLISWSVVQHLSFMANQRKVWPKISKDDAKAQKKQHHRRTACMLIWLRIIHYCCVSKCGDLLCQIEIDSTKLSIILNIPLGH